MLIKINIFYHYIPNYMGNSIYISNNNVLHEGGILHFSFVNRPRTPIPRRECIQKSSRRFLFF